MSSADDLAGHTAGAAVCPAPPGRGSDLKVARGAGS